MILYHGGLEAIASPDLVHSRKAVDFGPGFYVWKRQTCSCVLGHWRHCKRCGSLEASRYDGKQESS